MSSLEERVAYLEGRFEDHTNAMDDLRIGIAGLRHEMSALRTELRGEMRTLDTGLRGEMNRRFELVDVRFVNLDHKIDRHFTWLVGIQVAVLVSVVGALVGSYYK